MCNFTFSLGDLPNFRLPEAGPNSPGDVQLNVGNNIITRGWDETDGGRNNSCLLMIFVFAALPVWQYEARAMEHVYIDT